MKIYHTKLRNDGRNNHAGVGGGGGGCIGCNSLQICERFRNVQRPIKATGPYTIVAAF